MKCAVLNCIQLSCWCVSLKGFWNTAWGKCRRFRDKRRPRSRCMLCLYPEGVPEFGFPCPFRAFLITIPISWAVGPGWIPLPLQDESQSCSVPWAFLPEMRLALISVLKAKSRRARMPILRNRSEASSTRFDHEWFADKVKGCCILSVLAPAKQV